MNIAPVSRALLLAAGLASRKLLREPRDAFLAARMAFWVVVVSLLARHTTLPRAHRMASCAVRNRESGDCVRTAAALARTLDGLLRLNVFAFEPSCWKRAIVLQRFLALAGIESRVIFGVRTHADGRIDGHAWLEHQGEPLLDETARQYVAAFNLPAPASLPR